MKLAMQSRRASAPKHVMLMALGALFAGAARAGLVVRHHSAALLSPVTRVVELLQALQQKVEEEGKKEEDLYEKFVCWGQAVLSAKDASNAETTSRIDMLTTYLADLDAGRIELTTERADLEKEIEQLNADIKLATEIRSKEENDFTEASDEMEQAIEALTSAIEVLKTATAGHREGVLLRLKNGFSSRMKTRTLEATALSYAIHLGDKLLTKGDALFLHRLLTAEVPTRDWKKLNRPATFKMGYKARSSRIQDVLAKLMETFTTNLADAQKKEAEAKSSFDKLMGSKGTEKAAAEEALEKLEKEKGASGMSRTETQKELDKLNAQVENDKKYIAEVTKALADKKQEWKDRKALRLSESEAISKAISILHSDDARDTFKKSLKSQSYSLLQEDSSISTHASRGPAAAALRQVAAATRDKRLLGLALLASTGHFDEVFTAIDTMLSLLQKEEASDLEKKETCETDRATDTREAVVDSRKMDEMTKLITRLTSEVEEIKVEVTEKTKEVKSMEDELQKATQLREEEHAEYVAAKKDDEDAVALVHDAKAVLEGFYKENGLMLAQRQRQPDIVVQAGMAPPPPPSTWETPYEGQIPEATGIVSVLTMILEDIKSDIEKAVAAEDQAAKAFDVAKLALTKDIENLNTLITSLSKTQGEKEEEVETTKNERRAKQGSLDAVLKKIAEAESGCSYFTVNFGVRSRNRQIEIDGLIKAKAILQGADFAMPADPSRELHPGDALLQLVQSRHS